MALNLRDLGIKTGCFARLEAVFGAEYRLQELGVGDGMNAWREQIAIWCPGRRIT